MSNKFLTSCIIQSPLEEYNRTIFRIVKKIIEVCDINKKWVFNGDHYLLEHIINENIEYVRKVTSFIEDGRVSVELQKCGGDCVGTIMKIKFSLPNQIYKLDEHFDTALSDANSKVKFIFDKSG